MDNEILAELQIIKSLVAAKENSWLPKQIMSTLTGLKTTTLNNMVCQGKILKKKNLYSYRSYLEYCEIKFEGRPPSLPSKYRKRGGKSHGY